MWVTMGPPRPHTTIVSPSRSMPAAGEVGDRRGGGGSKVWVGGRQEGGWLRRVQACMQDVCIRGRGPASVNFQAFWRLARTVDQHHVDCGAQPLDLLHLQHSGLQGAGQGSVERGKAAGG